MKKLGLIFAILSLVGGGKAYADQPQTLQVNSPVVLIAGAGSSARVALPTNATDRFVVSNNVDVGCFIKTGDSTVTAAATDMPVLAGSIQAFMKNTAHTHVAAICPSAASGNIYFAVGVGE